MKLSRQESVRLTSEMDKQNQEEGSVDGSLASQKSFVEEPELSQTQLSATSHVAQKKIFGVQENERQKKPFSEASLFTALLESQVAGGDRWDLEEML